MTPAQTDFVDPEKFFDCVHCGLCLSFCPTYVELGTEMDSPRGRIATMRALHEGRFSLDPETVRHLDLCLGCRACETACPSGVHYGELIEGVRPFIEQYYRRPLRERLKRKLINSVFPHPLGVRAFALLLKIAAALGVPRLARARWVPRSLRYWCGLVPESMSGAPLAARYAAIGEKRYTVALLSGCVASAVFGATNQATIAVLRQNGCEVLVPPGQGCCGALLLHNGDRAAALALACHNIAIFAALPVDAIIVNAAGCGAVMKEYGELCKDDARYREQAAQLAAKVRDITEFLGSIPLIAPAREVRAHVTYHDACHLAHGQGIREQPRRLLQAIPGLRLTELAESDWCCGSAGTYNLTEPEMARRLLARKVGHIRETGAEVVVMGNPGCLLQIRAGLRQEGLPVRAMHTVELLAEAYGIPPS
ncbi:MAG: heterodisulfide reductase-related iron-sulfur binding cluster [Candidatus Binatia bacterium]|nr:heterodisulfide reductase-related iron-sulfur binding cluster [Candidatus Binatia bacterium]